MSELPLPSDPGMDQRRDWIVDIIVDHPKLWGILALVALATTFSPKVSVGAMWFLLLIAEVLAVFLVWGLVRNKKWNRGWILFVATVVGASLFSYGYWLAAPVKAKDGQSRLEVVKVQGLPMQKKDTQQVGFFLNIFYADKGDLATTAMTHRTLYFTDSHLPSSEDIARYMKQASEVEPPASRNDGNEIQPGLLPEHFFTVPQDDSEAIQLKSWADEVTSGRTKLYLFVTMKYFDPSLPKDQVRVTEFCGVFEGTFDLWHNCGNRMYVTSLAKQP
jgi:hypothetical protein